MGKCMLEQPKVSVIIPTYKRASLVGRAVQSVLDQTYPNFEVIVVDDNAPDTPERAATEEAMRPFEGCESVRYVRHERNMNGSAARNTGIRNSDGKYVMFLDDDDYFYPEKIAAQVDCMEALDDTWAACYCRYVRVRNGETVMKCAETRSGDLLEEELKRNLFVHAGSNLLIRWSVVNEIGGFDETFRRNQDVEFLCRVLQKYKLAFADTLGLAVNMHEYETPVDMERLTEQYIAKFGGIIDEQPEASKKRIYQMLNLQVFRYLLQSKKQPGKAFAFARAKGIKAITLIRYIVYLFYRKLFKKSMGFTQ